MDKTILESSISGAAAGDPRAEDELCRILRPAAEAFARRKLGAAARRWVDPADVAQQALLELVRGLRALDAPPTPAELKARLFRIADSRLKDAIRQRGRDVGESAAGGAETPSPRATDGAVTREDDLRSLRVLVARLPERYRVVVEGLAFQGRPLAELAADLDLAPETVQKRYERARKALRDMRPEPGA